jgi:hypothetical protein
MSYGRDFLDGNGSPTLSEVENSLVRKVVNSIIPRLVATEERVKVLLAQGDIKKISKLGEAGLWQKMVEALEMMQPLKDPKKEAYRLYNIGLGYEALAYQAEEIPTSRRFLDKASILYNQAIEMKPDEKYFREPQNRIESAILQYKKLEDQIASYVRAKELKGQEAAKNQQVLSPPNTEGSKDVGRSGSQQQSKPADRSAGKPLTNQDVIALANKGLDEANLIAAIKQAQSVRFDLSSDALLNLLQNKVSNKVITAMRTRQNPSQSAPRRPRTKRNQ